MDEEAHYAQIGRLIQTMPPFASDGHLLSPDENLWLGRVHAIVTIVLGQTSAGHITNLSLGLNQNKLARGGHAEAIRTILYKALAKVELKISPASQGAFIPANSVFDALAVLSKVIEQSQADLLIVDPYMDEKVLTDFAVLLPERRNLRLLTDAQHMKPGLTPAGFRWKKQYAEDRPLEVRKAKARTLHDRLIIKDGREAWVLTQSLNAFAARAPASIVRSDDTTAALKVIAYQDIWLNAESII